MINTNKSSVKVIRRSDPVDEKTIIKIILVWVIWGLIITPAIVLFGLLGISSDIPALTVAAAIALLGSLAGLVAMTKYIQSEKQKMIRAQKVAAQRVANGYNELSCPPSDTYPPFIYSIGRQQEIIHPSSGNLTNGNAYSVMHYRYTTGSGKNKRTHLYSMLHFQISKHLPHIVLDSHTNDELTSSIPVYFNDGQRIVLEGDFNKHFDLYAPEGYSVEALDIISPDFMQELITSQAAYDIEINGNSVYLITDDYVNYGQLETAANRLNMHLAYKMSVWQPRQDQQASSGLAAVRGQRALKIKGARISTTYFSTIAIAIYVAVRIPETGLLGEDPITRFLIVATVLVAAAIGLAYLFNKLASKK